MKEEFFEKSHLGDMNMSPVLAYLLLIILMSNIWDLGEDMQLCFLHKIGMHVKIAQLSVTLLCRNQLSFHQSNDSLPPPPVQITIYYKQKEEPLEVGSWHIF